MAKYELTEEQVNVIIQIIAQANIKGADAPRVVDVTNALARPLPDEGEQKEQ